MFSGGIPPVPVAFRRSCGLSILYIILDGSMTEEQVFQLIAESYTLTQPKRAAKAQSE